MLYFSYPLQNNIIDYYMPSQHEPETTAFVRSDKAQITAKIKHGSKSSSPIVKRAYTTLDRLNSHNRNCSCASQSLLHLHHLDNRNQTTARTHTTSHLFLSMAASTATADALPVIDLRLFTQSDLRALATSSSAFDFSSRIGADGDDVPVPKIDRAVFNESAGSRKQTYSRLRLAPRKTEVSGSRIGEERVKKVDEVEEWENRRIVAMLKELVGEESGEGEVFEGLVAVEVECDPELDVKDVEMVRQEVRVEVGSVSPVRRKRGRPRKDSEVYVNRIVLDDVEDGEEFGGEKLLKRKGMKRDEDDMEMMNKNGVMVDVVALGNAEDPFGPEMKRRTEGMSTKEQLLEFLSGLEGQWVSRRRKRKIVDASCFGDVLPRGWKLVFSIKKKAGHAWLICRQYIRFLFLYV